jgi:hypothetical protein
MFCLISVHLHGALEIWCLLHQASLLHLRATSAFTSFGDDVDKAYGTTEFV